MSIATIVSSRKNPIWKNSMLMDFKLMQNTFLFLKGPVYTLGYETAWN